MYCLGKGKDYQVKVENSKGKVKYLKRKRCTWEIVEANTVVVRRDTAIAEEITTISIIFTTII